MIISHYTHQHTANTENATANANLNPVEVITLMMIFFFQIKFVARFVYSSLQQLHCVSCELSCFRSNLVAFDSNDVRSIHFVHICIL